VNLPGFTDSLAAFEPAPQECPRCHGSSRIVHGLCLGCLLRSSVIVPGEKDEMDEFDSVLASVEVPDTNWRLGNYEILEEIGRGGMGVIYRARQRISRRIVALKRVLSYRTESRDMLARFRREAETASTLDHPNILPIFEVGESEYGIPFFTMKYAAGGSLQRAAPALRDKREIVGLMVKVTRAVQYAHGRGILHRDLKPGNILLDGNREPLVSDFGFAKWLDTPSDLTRTLTIFGTPGYIAPEQAVEPAASIKPAADIYSLGAILFDLLTGRPPFLGENALAVIRQAADQPAPKLRSLVLDADEDLDTICARCLEREPSARYASAEELAGDLERWFEGRPILARPVTPAVRLWRWSRRNPLLAGVTTAFASLFVLFNGLYAWHWHSQTKADAEIAKLREGVMQFAQVEAQICQPGETQRQEEVYLALSKQLGIDLAWLHGKLPPFAAALKNAPSASKYERANAAYVARDYKEAEQLALSAATDARKTNPVNTKGVIQALELAGLSAQAAIQFQRAWQHFKEAEALTDPNRDAEEWARLQDAIATLLFDQGKYPDAEQLFRRVIAVRTRAMGPENPDTLASRNRLIYVLNEEEKHEEAETEARQVVTLREKILGSEHPDTLLSRYNLASALYHGGKYAQAEQFYREVVAADERVIGPEHPRTLAAHIGLANTLNDQGKYKEAIDSYRRVIQLDNKAYGPEHPVTLNDRMDLATALHADHQYVRAEAEYRAVVALQTKVLGPEHAYTLNTRNNLAELLDDSGKYGAAEKECRQILDLERKVVGSNHRLTLNTRANLAVALLYQGKLDDAQREIAEVTRLMNEHLGVGYPETVNFTRKFATGLVAQKQTQKAIDMVEHAAKAAREKLGADHPATHRYEEMLRSLSSQNK
jgi:serine/threonine protein kinase